MKYEITYTCGHTGTVDIFGPGINREKKIEWMKTCKCPECEKAERESYIAEFEAKNALPNLNGSEKQINWAKSLREKRFKEIDEFAEKQKEQNAKVAESHPELEEKREKANASIDSEVAKIKRWLKSETAARFWIDNRDESFYDLVKKHVTDWNK